MAGIKVHTFTAPFVEIYFRKNNSVTRAERRQPELDRVNVFLTFEVFFGHIQHSILQHTRYRQRKGVPQLCYIFLAGMIFARYPKYRTRGRANILRPSKA